MPRSVSSESVFADDEVVNAVADAILAGKAEAEAAWRLAGVVCANHMITRHPEYVPAELAEADAEWNTPCRLGPRWLALIGGYRETLREYTERGND